MSQRYIGGLIYNPPGGFSGYFDGSGDNLSLATATALGSGNTTVEFWFFPTDSSVTYRSVYDSRSSTGTDTGYGIFQYGLTIEVYGNGLKVATAANAFAVNTWTHVALVRNSGTCQLYINGNASGASGTYSNNLTSTVRKIGDSVNNIYPFVGYISNLREVTSAVYTAAFTPPVGPLQAITNTSLLTCAYPTFRDGSSNNFTITVNGNTAVSTQNPFPLTQLPNPALGNQGNGVYSMSQYQALRSQNLWPAIDPYFDYVTLMLHGNGTNGAQNNTFLDSSTNNFTITRNGNTTQGTFTPYGSLWSNYFNGGANHLSVAAASAIDLASSDFTIECWVQPGTQTNAVDAVFGYGGFTTMLYRNGNTWSWEVGNGSSANYFTITANFTPNTWQHIALTRSGNTFTFWLNGVSAGTNSTANAVGTSGKTLSIGYNSTAGAVQYFTGYISNFRIVKGTAVYQSAFTPPAAPLTAITNTSLLTCQSNRFIDNSTNNFTITLVGSPSVQRFSPFNPTTPYAAGTIGGSGYFDGNGDYLSTNYTINWSTYGSYTLEFWVYHTTMAPTNQMYFAGGTGGTGNTIFYNYANGRVGVGIAGTNEVVSGAGVIKANTWQHVAYTFNGTTTKIYVDGVEVASGTTAIYANSSVTLSVGGGSASSSFVMNGYMANLRLSQSVIYTTAFTPPTSPVTGGALLLNFTNGGIFDNAMMNDLETVGNAQISTSVSKFGGGSIAFDGTGDYLVSNAGTTNLYAFGTGDFTIEFWLYLNASGTYLLYDSRASGAQDISPVIYIDTGTLKYLTNNADRITGNALSTTTWIHVAVCRAGTSTRMFVNGTQVGSTYTDSNNYINSAGRPFIGANSSAVGANSLNGYLDDLRITKGYARYTANFTPQRSQWQDQ